ncbi:TonB-dependent receptor [Sphingomonas sp.]|uniref:TonB-dependent receptor n=1 Tax=Sphingomonas sp. TaxID=28214 RepID=UPI0035C84EC2
MKMISSMLGLLATVAASPALAQESAPQQPGEATAETSAPGNDIVVTATRDTDSPLLEQAGAATSLNESVYRFSGSTRRADVLRTVPGVTVLDLGNRSTIVVRGLATAPDGDPNGSAVQNYLGGVALSGLGGSRELTDISNYDIERIDVLRGPQGYDGGGGALGGIVRLVPRPADTHEYSGYAAASVRDVRYGRNFGWEVDGFVNLPIVRDTLALRVTGYANREESPYRLAPEGRQSKPGRVRGGRASLRYEPSDALTIDLRYVYDDRDLPDLSRSVADLGDYVTSDFRETEGTRSHLGWAEADWRLGFATLSYVGSYGDVYRRDDYFASFYSGPDGEQIEPRTVEKTRSTTQELRLADQDGTGLDWVVGGYFEWRKRDSDTRYFVLGTETQSPVLSFDPAMPNQTADIRKSEEETRAGFGEVSYWATPTLKVTGGLRYQWNKQDNRYIEEFEDGSPPTDPSPYANVPSTGKLWWKGNVTWTPSPRQLYYLQVAQANRPGGLNYSQFPAGCDPAALARVRQFYNGDRIRTYESGAKVQDAGGFATVNASAYYSDWRDAPVYAAVPCEYVTSVLDNVKRMEAYGVEFDATLRFTRALSTTLTATWAETRIAEVYPNFGGGEVGERTPGNPTWKLSGALDYVTDIGPDLRLFAGGRVDYLGAYKNALSMDWSNLAAITGFPGIDGVMEDGTHPNGLVRYTDPGAGDYALVSARIGLQSRDWTGSLFVDNLFDSHARTIINVLDYTPAFDATLTRVTPRTIGVRVERRF